MFRTRTQAASNTNAIASQATDDTGSVNRSPAQSKNSLWRLILLRTIFALFVFVAAAVLGDPSAASRSVAPIILASLLLSAVYALLLRFAPLAARRQTAVQFGCDVLLVTWLVAASGDLRSPYVALYIVVISLASLYQGARGALLISVIAGAAYTATMLARAGDFSTSYAPTLSGGDIQIIGSNVAAFFIVGLLAARLAARQSGAQAATSALANLRALHERIVESMRSGVVTLDLEHRIYTFNSAAEEITGYTAAQMQGQDAARFFGDLDERIDESLRAAYAGEKSPRYEAECPTPEGLAVRLGFQIFPLHAEAPPHYASHADAERRADESGVARYKPKASRAKPTGVVIIFQDLTEVRALEDTARRQDRLAAVGRMAAGIAHEIRNPLASISGSVQVLRAEANGDPAQIELMDIVLRESERLNRIITDYLIYARPRAAAPCETDVRPLLHETLALMRYSPEFTEEHTLEEHLPDEPLRVIGEPDRLKQVFSNLVRNALQAMPDSGRLRVEAARLASGRVRLSFTDTGCGMDARQVERLFEPFQSTKPTGTGLGLPIVYQIVRDHNGTINVHSREGAGTTIAIELPGVN